MNAVAHSKSSPVETKNSIVQPWRGVIGLVAIVALSNLLISRFNQQQFTTWVSFIWIACVPAQIVIGFLWKPAGFPGWIAKLPQPAKGACYTALATGIGLVAASAIFAIIGLVVTPPRPPVVMYSILTVILTFWFVIVWQFWPASIWTRAPAALGAGCFVFAYGIGFGLFRAFFNFDFLQGSGLYVESMNPHGLFSAWAAISFGVLTIAVLFAFVMLDFWPLSSDLTRQPMRGTKISLSIIAVAASIFEMVIGQFRLDVVKFLSYESVPFIFGSLVVIQIFEDRPLGSLRQPWKGLCRVAMCGAVGCFLNLGYLRLARWYVGALIGGPPAYAAEIWISSALLAVTFPLIVIACEFLEFWPLKRCT